MTREPGSSNGTPLLEIEGIRVLRGRRPVLEVDHLALLEGETLAVIGPNGAGKSTLLLILARLLKAERGRLFFHGQAVEAAGELAYRRRIGLVLQDPLLLEMSVFDNVASGLRFRKTQHSMIAPRVDAWLEHLGVGHLRSRPARSLSGGEAQRTSLARAFALQPELMLLDEPFSALDAPTRTRLLEDFQALLASTRQTTVFVTHDLDEALLLGHRVAVMLGGRIRQVGTLEQVFNTPADADVAHFVGIETVIAGRVIETREGQVIVEAGKVQLQAVGELAAGRSVLLCLRPEDITLWRRDGTPTSSARNRLYGRIQRLLPQGPLVRVVVDCGFPLVALITRTSAREMELEEGQPVIATFKSSAVHLIPR